MSWIREAETREAANVTRVMSIQPRAMNAVTHMGRAIDKGASALTRTQEEAIAAVVSVINRCRY